jgi:hypothetical protein
MVYSERELRFEREKKTSDGGQKIARGQSALKTSRTYTWDRSTRFGFALSDAIPEHS